MLEQPTSSDRFAGSERPTTTESLEAGGLVELRAVLPATARLRAEPRVEARPRAVAPSTPLVVVLGMSETGLGAMRLLAPHGVRCWGVDSRPDQPAFSSRYCERWFRTSDDVSASELTCVLSAIASAIPGRSTLLPTADRFVRLLSGLRAELRGHFDLALPPSAVVDDLLDKQRFARRAAHTDLRVPRTVPVVDFSRLADAVGRIGYPAVVKPRVSDPGLGGFPKAVVVHSEEELCALLNRHAGSAVPELIAQEYIPGDDSRHLSVAVALDRMSRPVATFVARKRRQGNHGAGVGTFVEGYRDDEAAAIARTFLQRIGYVGVAEVELKRHALTNELFAIEVNPRLWSQVTLPAASGLNFPLLCHRIAAGLAVDAEVPSCTPPSTWQDLWGDCYWTFCKGGYWRRGEVSLAGWLRQALTSRGHPFFAWRDPGPALKRLWHGVIRSTRNA